MAPILLGYCSINIIPCSKKFSQIGGFRKKSKKSKVGNLPKTPVENFSQIDKVRIRGGDKNRVKQIHIGACGVSDQL
nr:MAG TPA: hypothetical protein [Caudoviricetes sp.]